MSFYRSILAAVAAVAIASPVFADDTTNSTTGSDQSAASAMTSDNSNASGSASSAKQAATKVNVNTANVKELMKVKGLTKANAKAIIAYRKAHGNFQNVDDLTNNIKGLKASAVEQLTAE